jgi:hypothetical protein
MSQERLQSIAYHYKATFLLGNIKIFFQESILKEMNPLPSLFRKFIILDTLAIYYNTLSIKSVQLTQIDIITPTESIQINTTFLLGNIKIFFQESILKEMNPLPSLFLMRC